MLSLTHSRSPPQGATKRAAIDGGADAASAELAIYEEAKILEQLSVDRHRNMLRFHGWWQDDLHVYIAQQLCLGGELPEWLSRQPLYNEQLAAKVIYDLLQAITYCHSRGVCHRDVKPQNLLFTSFEPSAYLKLCDYGLATHWEAESSPPLSEFCGTLDYASPEMLAHSYTLTTDVWSVGVLLHVLLTGRNPFRGPSKAATEHRVRLATFSTEDKDGWAGVSDSAKALTKSLLASAVCAHARSPTLAASHTARSNHHDAHI